MIRTLRRKFILIAMVSLIGTLTIICAAIAGGTYSGITQRADKIIQLLHQNEGEFPTLDNSDDSVDPAQKGGLQITRETPFETRFCIVRLTKHREVAHVDTEHIAAMDRQSIINRIGEIIEDGKTSGYSDYYRYRIFSESDGGTSIILLDYFQQLQSFYNLLRVALMVSLLCVMIVFVLLFFLSKKIIRPFIENLERQRQFVTDASHELKTPLAVLSANVGLLEEMYGNNKWFSSAQSQIVRLDKLIKSLIELARTEESMPVEAVSTFSLSEIAEANLEAFQSLAEAAGKRLSGQITPKLIMHGVPDNLFRLFTILLDNAIKYCDPGETITLSLTTKGGNLVLTVSNPCKELDAAQIPRFFDRFYRADSSRSRATGGYGIGLSTAKAIVSRHHGKLFARTHSGQITFTALFPAAVRRGTMI